jgi:sialate O-acetylesterase
MKSKICLLLILLLPVTGYSQLRLPRMYADGMVLQRDVRATIHGWSGPGAGIALRLGDSTYTATADSAGNWLVALAPKSAGGPFEMRVASGKDTITLRNVLFGDVWVASGQSNMELPMKRVSPLYESVVARSENPQIRQFLVPQRYNFKAPESDFPSGSWESVNPVTVLDFSAVAYFFAASLYERFHVPIGIVNTSLGGSPVESWMSEEALQAFPRPYEEALRFKQDSLIHRIESGDNARIGAWYTLVNRKDAGYRNPRKPWSNPGFKPSGWLTMTVPGGWASTSIGPVNGVVWVRKEFDAPPSIVKAGGTLVLGRIVDADSAWINGMFVGTTTYQYPPRRYPVPPHLLKRGKNVIVVRVVNSAGTGQFVPDKQYAIVSPTDTIDLAGQWRCRLGATMEPLASQTFIRWKPLGLYNAMLAPLLGTRIRGVIWYQGESNTNSPYEYRELFPAMIADWRKQWHQGDFPFLYVQLTSFMQSKPDPSESDWALLRESQTASLLVPNTGMAVTIDIGEWNDIHPLNKFDVGRRLALSALRVAYGDSAVTASGPLYKSMRIQGDSVVIHFTGVGGGLWAPGADTLRQFAIAGEDRKFVWAHAQIWGDSVLVWGSDVSRPVAVRYAWADNPVGANLFNREGLPASPFRTDDWPARPPVR